MKIQIKMSLIQQKEMNQTENLQEEEEHLNSKEGQEAIKEGVLRKRTRGFQLHATTC
jgi:hypothetical protein